MTCKWLYRVKSPTRASVRASVCVCARALLEIHILRCCEMNYNILALTKHVMLHWPRTPAVCLHNTSWMHIKCILYSTWHTLITHLAHKLVYVFSNYLINADIATITPVVKHADNNDNNINNDITIVSY